MPQWFNTFKIFFANLNTTTLAISKMILFYLKFKILDYQTIGKYL